MVLMLLCHMPRKMQYSWKVFVWLVDLPDCI